MDENLAILSASLWWVGKWFSSSPALGVNVFVNVTDMLDLYYALLMSLHKGLPTWYHQRLRRQKGIVVIKKTMEDQVNASYEEPPSPHHFNRREVVEESSGSTWIVSLKNYKRRNNTWGKPRRLHEARSKARLLNPRTPRVGWVVYPLCAVESIWWFE